MPDPPAMASAPPAGTVRPLTSPVPVRPTAEAAREAAPACAADAPGRFRPRPLAFDTLALPVPADLLVHTPAAEWRARRPAPR